MDIVERIDAYLRRCHERHKSIENVLMACRDEIVAARGVTEMMLQGTGQTICESLLERVIEANYPTRWIPVAERLPKDFCQVLVTSGSDCLLAYCSNWRVHDTPLWMAESGRCFPTHWMPLPALPSVEQ